MKTTITYLLISIVSFAFAQDSLSELLEKHNKESIPYIYVSELAKIQSNVIVLDARELEEYTTSHIKNAIHIGYNTFNKDTLKTIDKTTLIVVYCSLGIRSERIAEKLKKRGYTSVYNLYGGIFEWKNKDYKVYDSNEKETDNIHAYSKAWSKWLKKGNKVY